MIRFVQFETTKGHEGTRIGVDSCSLVVSPVWFSLRPRGKSAIWKPALVVVLTMVLATLLPSAFAQDLSLTRSFDQRVALTNSPIVVTVTFTNTGTNNLRGFFFTDQLPSSLTVTTLSVVLNGQALTNFTAESGQAGDVYAGCVPWRWIVETPTNLAEANPIPPQAAGQIVYSISSGTTGSFSLQPFNWATGAEDGTNVLFGYGQSAAEGIVKFVDQLDIPLLSGQSAVDGFRLWLDGAPFTPYVISASSDTVDWVPLITNTSPFEFIDTNAFLFPARFYQGAPAAAQ